MVGFLKKKTCQVKTIVRLNYLLSDFDQTDPTYRDSHIRTVLSLHKTLGIDRRPFHIPGYIDVSRQIGSL